MYSHNNHKYVLHLPILFLQLICKNYTNWKYVFLFIYLKIQVYLYKIKTERFFNVILFFLFLNVYYLLLFFLEYSLIVSEVIFGPFSNKINQIFYTPRYNIRVRVQLQSCSAKGNIFGSDENDQSGCVFLKLCEMVHTGLFMCIYKPHNL